MLPPGGERLRVPPAGLNPGFSKPPPKGGSGAFLPGRVSKNGGPIFGFRFGRIGLDLDLFRGRSRVETPGGGFRVGSLLQRRGSSAPGKPQGGGRAPNGWGLGVPSWAKGKKGFPLGPFGFSGRARAPVCEGVFRRRGISGEGAAFSRRAWLGKRRVFSIPEWRFRAKNFSPIRRGGHMWVKRGSLRVSRRV